MILVDTSVWVAHLRSRDAALVDRLEHNAVLGHPWVVGEIALCNLDNRVEVLAMLVGLPQAALAQDEEVLRLIDGEALSASGIGYVDAQLLAATRLTPGAVLWTRDKRLQAVAQRLGLAHQADNLR